MTERSYTTLLGSLDDVPVEQPFVTMWNDWDNVETVTFGEFRDRCTARRAFLEDHGLANGDTAILVMPQGIDVMVTFVAAMMAGAAPTILAYPNTKVDLSKYRSGLVGVSGNLAARLIVVDEDLPDEFVAVLQGATGASVVRSPGARSADGVSGVSPPARHLTSQLAFIQHSSGTTGLQKGVALSHAAVLRQLHHLAGALRLRPDDRIYSWLPLYHDMGLIACFMLPLVYHLPVVMQSPVTWLMQPAAMLELITELRCTLAWIPNFTYQFLADRVPPHIRSGLDLSTLRAVINCSEPVRAESIVAFHAAFAEVGLRADAVQTSYAMAENVFAVTQSSVDASCRPRTINVDPTTLRKQRRVVLVPPESSTGIRIVSSGHCLPETEVAVRGANNEELPDGHVGQLAIRSACLFDGYYKRPDLTEEALRDGWYYSGDLGFRLEQDVFVIGRGEDMIIVGGQNFYPEDVESIVSDHSAVRSGRVVALGVHHRNLGTDEIVVVAETTVAAPEQDDLAVAEKAIRAAIFAQLNVSLGALLFKPPRWIVKSTAGKPARAETRRRLLLEHPEFAALNTLRLEHDGRQ